MDNKFQKIIDDIRNDIFLSPKGDNVDKLLELTKLAVKNLVSNQGEGPTFPTFKTKTISEITKEASVPGKYNFNHDADVDDIGTYMQRAVKANSPYMVKNLIPQPSFVYLASYLAASLYMGNAVTGEDAGEALKAELSCATAIAKLAGLDPEKSSGVFTFGGTGTNFYAQKIALAKIYPEHTTEGISKNDVVVVGNRASHYSQQTAVNWLGIGQNNYRQVNTNIDQTTDLVDLERECRNLLTQGKEIACIEAVGGTTSHMAIDDLEEVYAIRERLINDFKLNYMPHLHCDSVQGWIWLNFVHYDFQSNPLGFENNILEKARKNSDKISKLHLMDSFGVDFHKTGYVPYNSSMVILKDKENFNLLKRKKDLMTPLFHDDKEYNPGIYTIETSRSCANILATWLTLKSFGQEGYQALLGHALMMRELFVKAHKRFNEVGLVLENVEASSADIYVRCIKTGPDVIREHQKELEDDQIVAQNTKYTSEFFEWYTTIYEQPKIAFSKSTASFYNHNQTPIFALRFYLLSANNTDESVEFIISHLIEAKKEFDSNHLTEATSEKKS